MLNIYTNNLSGLPVQAPSEPLLNIISNTDFSDKNITGIENAEITNAKINFIQGKDVEEGTPLLTINQKLLINTIF